MIYTPGRLMGLGAIPAMPFAPGLLSTVIPGATTGMAQAVAAREARSAECTSTCSSLNAQFPVLYPKPAAAGCHIQCMADRSVTPLESICAHRYSQRPELISGCVAAGGAHPAGAPAPEQGGRPLWHYLAIGGAVLGIGYVGYRLLKS